MACQACEVCVQGQHYQAIGQSPCVACGSLIDITGMVELYLGYDRYNGLHVFRLHKSVYCEGCWTRLYLVSSPCENHSRIHENTKELNKLFNINQDEDNIGGRYE